VDGAIAMGIDNNEVNAGNTSDLFVYSASKGKWFRFTGGQIVT
jgi:hypothetical protein